MFIDKLQKTITTNTISISINPVTSTLLLCSESQLIEFNLTENRSNWNIDYCDYISKELYSAPWTTKSIESVAIIYGNVWCVLLNKRYLLLIGSNHFYSRLIPLDSIFSQILFLERTQELFLFKEDRKQYRCVYLDTYDIAQQKQLYQERFNNFMVQQSMGNADKYTLQYALPTDFEDCIIEIKLPNARSGELYKDKVISFQVFEELRIIVFLFTTLRLKQVEMMTDKEINDIDVSEEIRGDSSVLTSSYQEYCLVYDNKKVLIYDILTLSVVKRINLKMLSSVEEFVIFPQIYLRNLNFAIFGARSQENFIYSIRERRLNTYKSVTTIPRSKPGLGISKAEISLTKSRRYIGARLLGIPLVKVQKSRIGTPIFYQSKEAENYIFLIRDRHLDIVKLHNPTYRTFGEPLLTDKLFFFDKLQLTYEYSESKIMAEPSDESYFALDSELKIFMLGTQNEIEKFGFFKKSPTSKGIHKIEEEFDIPNTVSAKDSFIG